MSLFFWRRGALRDFAEGIRPELRALPTPEPGAALFTRIMASREAGVRVIVPVGSAARSGLWRTAAVLAIAVVLLLVFVPRGAHRYGQSADVPDFASNSFFGEVAFAQTLSAVRPLSAPASPTGASVVRPMSLAYSRRIRDASGKLIAQLAVDMQITPDLLENVPVWRIASLDHNMSATRRYVNSDTLYVTRSKLAIVRRLVHVKPYSRYEQINVRQLFQGDSVFGRMTTDGPSIGQGRPIARELPKAFQPYITGELAPVFFMAVPLDREWRGSVSLLGWAVRPEDLFLPVDVRVEGEETVIVPAGRFDCWRLSIRFSGRQIDYWVRKSDRLAVRVRDDSEAATRGTREIVLVRTS